MLLGLGKRRVLGLGIACLIACSLASVAVAQTSEESPSADSQEAEEVDDLAINNPGSIVEQGRRDDKRKDYLFQIPGADALFEPWSELRADLLQNYGFRPGLSFTNLTQWASDTVPGADEDHASGFELNIDATWTFLGRETESPTMAGFEFLYRDTMGTDLPPAALFTQTGALYPSAVAFAEVDPTIGQLWIQQKFGNRFGFRIGKHFPVSSYDFFPLKNFRTDFIDPIHAANIAIPLPNRGLGGFILYRPQPDAYVRVGVHDANAETEKAGFNSLFDEGELFKIFEIGFDPGFMDRQPERPPFGDVHVSIWQQDERDDDNIDDGWGFVVSASQWFGDFLPFLRYGYSDSGSGGPAVLEHMVNGGVAFNNIFGQSDDRIGIGLTWAEPANGALDDQKAIDMFYRVQVTPQVAVSPTLQVIFDPVRNPDDDEIFTLGIRTRFFF